MKNKLRNTLRSINHYVWKLFLNGLLAILPLALTIGVFKITINFIARWLGPLRRLVPSYLDNPYAEFIVVILFILLIGTLLKTFVLLRIIDAVEGFLLKLPLVRPVYSGIKQLVDAFSGKDKISIKKVVLVEFPRKGIYSVGFLTGELAPVLSPDQTTKYYNVFVPTTPNPTTGFLLILPEQDIKIFNITRQEAMAMIMSGGIVQPETVECNLDKEQFFSSEQK